MTLRWPWMCMPLLVLLCSAESGSSLRGAVEALQRRQRSHARGPVAPALDYDAMYEFVPPGYPEPDYSVDIENFEEEPSPKYIIKLLDGNQQHPQETYEYKVIKKKNSRLNDKANSKESAFRERNHHSDERLRDLFFDRNEIEDKHEASHEKAENDEEYALLLDQIWSKYKTNKAHGKSNENVPQGVVKLYKEKIVKKRYPDNWGPIAFKKKRSSGPDIDRSISPDYDAERKQVTDPSDPNYNAYTVTDDDKDDWREEYAIAFQPLDEDPMTEISNDDQYSYDTIDKRFPVAKRSSGPNQTNNHKKRFVQKHQAKSFRSSSGTDPRIIKDLSKIFGDSEIEIIKNPVKRSADHEEHSHDTKPPKVTIAPQNHSHDHNETEHSDESHEHHGHLHHPGLAGKEEDHSHDHETKDKPLSIRKKSIDWSDYFGIDKRSKKYASDVNQERLRKQYFNTFNKEVIYPVNSFRKHSFMKRNYVPKLSDEIDENQNKEKRTTKEEDSKLDDIDKKLKTMEGMIVDEALHYTNAGDELDTKEEQEMKEKLLSRLAAAYSLEKMRKALKEFKQSLQTPKPDTNIKSSPVPTDESKVKRVAIKKEKVEINNNEIPIFSKNQDITDDFEDEQGAGHYLNGKFEQQYSEGYMGGSGRHRTPVMNTASTSGSCPVLSRIVQRCQGVDMLAGDRGQLFLPLCSLHQICYLCGEAPPTTCDLVFLSEADTSCEGDMDCQRAARSALMALRELHDSLADELDGECEASPCLTATLKLNIGWHRALQR